VTLVAILDADKEGFLRSAWSLIQMIGRAARNIGGEVIMYADTVTESMQVAIEETDRRRAVQAAYNVERGIEPTTIVKGIHDLNQRLRAVAESTIVYTSEREGGRPFDESDRVKVEALVARMEAEMRSAAKELEFERAAALRDEIQQIRLRVLEQDASITVARAAERAASEAVGQGSGGLTGAADRARGRRAAEAVAAAPGSILEVTSVTVLPAEDEPADSLDGEPGAGDGEGTASDWLPGIRDEHDDEGGWQARWLDRPTWDRAVTPNIRKRTGQRPARRGRYRG
jgi:hypothetical protein